MKQLDGLNTALGNTIRSLRIEKGLTQEQLAEKCESSAVYISEIERGIKRPTFETVFAISLSLDMEFHAFVKELEKNLSYSS